MKAAIKTVLVCLFLIGTVGYGEAKVKLPVLIADGMVLQRDTEIPVWGTADPGEQVEIHFLGKRYHVNADEKGAWTIQLAPTPAGGPYTMRINEIEVRNILIGDLWLCSGQSNMELPINRVMEKFREEVVNYSNPMIRHLKVPLSYDFHGPRDEIRPAAWHEATPESALTFSAVAYFFAKELFETTGVPIGLINASVGGSPAEAWISEEGLKPFPAHLNERDIWRNDELVESVKRLDRAHREAWHHTLYKRDEGYSQKAKWYEPEYDDSQWEEVEQFDKAWGSDGVNPINGVHWFRKTLTVPPHLAGQPALLRLGCIVDADSVYLNGRFVGTIAYQYPPRIYPVPEGLLKEGENNIAVRLVSHSGFPGFVEDKPYLIRFQQPANPYEINLEGRWKYRLGARMPSLPGETFFQYKPTGLYNAIISPLKRVPFKGVLWYQGESNVERYNEYNGLMKALINDWRTHWNQPDLPFLIVQLANFMQDPAYPSESDWAELREAQRKLVADTPGTGLVVTIDIGEWNDIHPLDKKEVGRRLSLQARRLAYGERETVADGPIHNSIVGEGDRLILSFEGDKSNDLLPVQKLEGFAIAGADGRYHWANASIEDNKVVVWSDSVPEPVSVRYAWGNNPEKANLKNRQGLPASPFEATLRVPEQTR
ncbi:MAG TPA: sialate O-acetylesterase [Petrimonas sp.]|nr:sialate O-acetylesterase [Petrimonas sp.]